MGKKCLATLPPALIRTGEGLNTLGVPQYPLKENIVVVGSELAYKSFWLKMMFVAPAMFAASDSALLRPADQTTIAYASEGYSRLEKLVFDLANRDRSVNIVRLSSSVDLINCFNDRPEGEAQMLIQDVVFFCHGVPGTVDVNYRGSSKIQLSLRNYRSLKPEVFISGAKLYSYACRTGISNASEWATESNAEPEHSLAQRLANHLHITTYAFHRRSFYGKVLRNASRSDEIARRVREGRDGHEGEVIDIPDDHEALPHLGLSPRGVPFLSRSYSENVNDYALWRKQGGRCLPDSGDTPSNLASGMFTYNPPRSP